MRRAKHDGTTMPSHVQAKIPGGGLSTAPEDIKSALHRQFLDWFAARKHGPGGGPYEGRPSVGELYDTELRPALMCVAYSVTIEEVMAAIKSAPTKSCPGPSGISIPFIKLFPDGYIGSLCSMFNLILAWGLLPKVFDEGFIFPIPKKGTFSAENCRPISLLEVHLKLLTRIINRRLVYALLDADFFAEEQFGFLPGRSCPDAFHILLGAIEDAKESDSEIHVCLIDLTKAFDSLSPKSLQQSYSAAGLSERSCKFLGSLDGTGKARVLTPFGPTAELLMEWGVRQGEVLSPLKFITWLNPWLKHIAEKFPEAGYVLQDGTRVNLLAYADDVAIVTHSHEMMKAITDDLCDFLRFHGVTLSADDLTKESKTKYMTNRFDAKDKRYALSLDCFNRDSRPGTTLIPVNHIVKANGPQFIFVYLGGRLNLNLDWTEINRKAAAGINMELARLNRKRYTLAEASAVASSIVQGKAGYILQLAQFPLATLKAWDSSLNKILRSKAGASHSGSPAMFHAPIKKGGKGVFTFESLACQSLGTELLVRLQSKGLGGRVARARLKATERKWPDHGRSTPFPPTKVHFTLFCLKRLQRAGYSLRTPANVASEELQFSTDHLLGDTPIEQDTLSRLTSLGFRFTSELFEPDSLFSLLPYDEVRRPSMPKSPPSWFTRLGLLEGSFMVRPTYEGLPPVPDHFLHPPDYTPHIIRSVERNAAAALQRRDGSMFWLDPAEQPDLNADLAGAFFFATDGSVKFGEGGCASVSPQFVAGWERHKSGKYFFKRSRWKAMGEEPLAISTMELLAVVQVLEDGPRNNLVILTDSAYVMMGISRHSPGPRKLIRQCDRALWLRAEAALTSRREDGHMSTFIKCSSHEKDSEQEANISLWNDRADEEAEDSRINDAPLSVWWPSQDIPHMWLFRGRAIRGDPRLHIRSTFEQAAHAHAATLKQSSSLASLTLPEPSLVALGPLRDLISVTKLARSGMYDAQGFIHCLLHSCLPTPSNNFATEDSIHLSAFLPRVHGKKVCPLCGDPEPDVFHYGALCPVTAAPRKELASTVASFLLGLGVAADYDMEYVHHLLDWFTSQVSGEPSDSSIFVEPHGLSGNVGLRVLLGEAEQGLKPPAPAAESRAEKFTRLLSLRRARLAGLAPPPLAPIGASHRSLGQLLGCQLQMASATVHGFQVSGHVQHQGQNKASRSYHYPAGQIPSLVF